MTNLTLKHPVTLGDGRTLTELTLRRAKVRDLRQAQRQASTEPEQELVLLGLLTGLVPEDVEELDMADYKALGDAFRQSLA